MTSEKKMILIVGAGRAGSALIKLFHDKESVKILGVVDKDEDAAGLKLAGQWKIPTGNDWSELIRNKDLDEVINATGSDEVQTELVRAKPEHVTIVSDYLTSALWFLAKEYESVEEKIKETMEEVEAQKWGAQKTNEAIKTLYKELEEKNKELQQLDRLKSDFISTVSHELRTPLAITKEGISLIQDGVLGPVSEKQAKVLKTSKESIDRLSRLIASLLDISKIEAGGGVEVDRNLVDLNHIVEQVFSLFESKASDKGIQLRKNIPDKAVDVYADKDKIIQVLTNLINNSIKFTERGHIEVAVVEKEDEFECSVADTGKGVPKNALEKMFAKFQQINREHRDGEQGTGLGLSIAKSIVELHDGRIWADSEEGKGTKITFTLPKEDEQDLFREIVDRGIKEAKESSTKMSLMLVSVDNTDRASGVLTDEEMHDVLKGVEGVLRTNLEQSQSLALFESRECAVIIPDSNEQSLLSAEGRLKQAIDDYLMHEQLTDKVGLRFGCATYPDEAQNREELVTLANEISEKNTDE